jgi:hypothetical protein
MSKSRPKKIQPWYDFIGAQKCMSCQSFSNIERAHISIFPSLKLGGLHTLHNSHHDIQAYSCIPLCSRCHRTNKEALHNSSEAKWLEENIEGGIAWIAGWIALNLARLWEGEL